MHGILRGGRGRRLDPAGYVADFDERFWRIGGQGFWKLERGQYFQEPGVDSWEMARDGDWAGSMELVESRRDAFGGHLARISAAGFSHHRVRVVEQPVTPYLQWELQVLQVKDQCGEDVRVVPAGQLADLEQEQPLPELVVLGADAVYEVHYTDRGLPDGGTRYTDRAQVRRTAELVRRLHARGEPLDSYVRREIAPLAPPAPGGL